MAKVGECYYCGGPRGPFERQCSYCKRTYEDPGLFAERYGSPMTSTLNIYRVVPNGRTK